MSKEIINAKITKTTITMSDHGCLTFYVFFDSNAIHCGIGGYCIGHGYLGAKDDVFDATDKGLVAMMKIMDTVGVERWEDLDGKYIRIEKPDWGDSCTKIGNIIEDKWFDIKEFFKEDKK